MASYSAFWCPLLTPAVVKSTVVLPEWVDSTAVFRSAFLPIGAPDMLAAKLKGREKQRETEKGKKERKRERKKDRKKER